MTSRNAARRHRGNNRMAARPPKMTWEEGAIHNGVDPDDLVRHPEANPYDAVWWWGQKIDEPLFVYFITELQDPLDGPVKIGKAINPIQRMRELQCGNPRPLVLAAVILAAVDSEERLHLVWTRSGVRGEWFQDENLLPLARRAQAKQINEAENGSLARNFYEIARLGTRLVHPDETGWRAA